MTRIFRRNRKAVVEIGFSWIFILIAGGVILGLFTYVAVQQGGFFRSIITANLLTDLDAIFVGAQVSRNTAAVFEIPRTRMQFSCTSYSIDGIAHPLLGRFVFAPEQLHTNELLTWSKSWSLGFRITNFLYITSPYIKYYVVHDDNTQDLARDIYNDLPARLSKEMIHIDGLEGEIENQNFDRIHVLVVREAIGTHQNTAPINPGLDNIFTETNFRQYRDNEISFVFVQAYNDFLRSGITDTYHVAFANKQLNPHVFDFANDGSSIYWQTVYDISAVYGGYISGNPDIFQCMMASAFTKSSSVINVYEERISILNQTALQCNYNQAFTAIDTMKEAFIDDTILIGKFAEGIVLLRNTNEVLERNSCPLLY